MSTVMSLASDLQYYPPEDINVAPYLMAFDAPLIDSYLSALRPDNVMITIADPSYKGPLSNRGLKCPTASSEGLAVRPAQSIKGGLTIPALNPHRAILRSNPNNDAQQVVTTRDLTLLLATDTEFGVPEQ